MALTEMRIYGNWWTGIMATCKKKYTEIFFLPSPRTENSVGFLTLQKQFGKTPFFDEATMLHRQVKRYVVYIRIHPLWKKRSYMSLASNRIGYLQCVRLLIYARLCRTARNRSALAFLQPIEWFNAVFAEVSCRRLPATSNNSAMVAVLL